MSWNSYNSSAMRIARGREAIRKGGGRTRPEKGQGTPATTGTADSRQRPSVRPIYSLQPLSASYQMRQSSTLRNSRQISFIRRKRKSSKKMGETRGRKKIRGSSFNSAICFRSRRKRRCPQLLRRRCWATRSTLQIQTCPTGLKFPNSSP